MTALGTRCGRIKKQVLLQFILETDDLNRISWFLRLLFWVQTSLANMRYGIALDLKEQCLYCEMGER